MFRLVAVVVVVLTACDGEPPADEPEPARGSCIAVCTIDPFFQPESGGLWAVRGCEEPEPCGAQCEQRCFESREELTCAECVDFAATAIGFEENCEPGEVDRFVMSPRECP